MAGKSGPGGGCGPRGCSEEGGDHRRPSRGALLQPAFSRRAAPSRTQWSPGQSAAATLNGPLPLALLEFPQPLRSPRRFWNSDKGRSGRVAGKVRGPLTEPSWTQVRILPPSGVQLGYPLALSPAALGCVSPKIPAKSSKALASHHRWTSSGHHRVVPGPVTGAQGFRWVMGHPKAGGRSASSGTRGQSGEGGLQGKLGPVPGGSPGCQEVIASHPWGHRACCLEPLGTPENAGRDT